MSILLKWLSRALISFFLLASVVATVSYHLASRSLPKYTQTITSDKIKNNVDYIVLSPGINPIKKKNLIKYKKKIITDIDLLYLSNKDFKSIVVTGTNGKSTTCKLISHLLKKNNFKVSLGGNIGTPILDLALINLAR